jgi:hypothetical protein
MHFCGNNCNFCPVIGINFIDDTKKPYFDGIFLRNAKGQAGVRTGSSRDECQAGAPVRFTPQEATMNDFFARAGALFRNAMQRSTIVSEEEYLADATDRIDLEMKMREYDRMRSDRRFFLGGSAYI